MGGLKRTVCVCAGPLLGVDLRQISVSGGRVHAVLITDVQTNECYSKVRIVSCTESVLDCLQPLYFLTQKNTRERNSEREDLLVPLVLRWRPVLSPYETKNRRLSTCSLKAIR